MVRAAKQPARRVANSTYWNAIAKIVGLRPFMSQLSASKWSAAAWADLTLDKHMLQEVLRKTF